jgi:hypothetical protein
MPRSDDHSAGDARQPYADEGGPAGHHAHSHDVRAEEASRAKAHSDEDDFAGDLVAEQSTGGHVDESILASDDKDVRRELPDLDGDDLKRVAVLTVGTRLDQGSTYVDLNGPKRTPFKAIGGEEADGGNRYIAKRDTDYEMWDRLVGQGRQVEVERPGQIS